MPTLRQRFDALLPGHDFIDTDAAAVTAYLRRQGVLREKGFFKKAESVTVVEPLPGGNMNFVVRVRLDRPHAGFGDSLIVKQARPWVERYPDIAAPVERAKFEARYYSLVGAVPLLAAHSPQLIHQDAGNHILVLEDLGATADLSSLYRGFPLDTALHDGERLLPALVRYLSTLHVHFRENPPARPVVNKAMRQLNHEHIFDLPFRRDNGLDLDAYQPGLKAAFAKTCDPVLAKAAQRLGELYLDLRRNDTLLHGDFYPGSFLLDGGRHLYVIDPEFCFTGPAEFDFGVFAAHLYLSGNGARVAEARALYGHPLEEDLWRGFAGVEILRRIGGVAQLPLGEVNRVGLLATSRRLILGEA